MSCLQRGPAPTLPSNPPGVDRLGPGSIFAPLITLTLTFLVAVGCGGSATPGGSGSAGRPGGPGVYLLILDTARRDALGCYGGPDGVSPHLDSIAADGVRFEQAISTSGWTLPSVASILTGAWPSIHGGLGKIVKLRPIREEIPTGAEVLAAAGWTTAGFANAAFVSPMLGLDRGFEHFDHRYTYNHDARRADETLDLVIDWVDANADERHFVLVHLFDPHLTYDPPGKYASTFTGRRGAPDEPVTLGTVQELASKGNGTPSASDVEWIRGVYHGEVAFLDAQVGRFLDTLKTKGLYDDATIIVVADHGEEFYEHGGFEHGHTLYDELVRVPLILKLPKSESAARDVVEEPVSLVDILPTVCDLHGVADTPPSFAGRSLLPLVRGRPDTPRAIFSESTLYGASKIAWRTPRYKYIVDLDPKAKVPDELYDWRDDPQETRNLVTADPALRNRMRGELHGFFTGLQERSKTLSKPEIVDMSPPRVKMLKDLGYIR